eukprot:TRINITY_DN184_c3_g1_i1.p1 TRINITY_DN184_c3_g1~~TRINITY_DN184_c3_g1_i1.p1  ORF type:complete len:766 (-),score=91.74 TRINITY_DN184_c3_g1_i1:340-2637(-)
MTVATFSRTLKAPKGTESTEYDMHETRQYREAKRYEADKYGHDRIDVYKSVYRYFILFAIGAGAGLIAITLDICVKQAFQLRTQVDALFQEAPALQQYAAHVGLCVALAAVAGFLVCFVEPLAAGSGIPEIKCNLNGIHTPNVVRFHTLIAKAVGICFSVGAGLPVGKEGPMIHSGAIVGAMMSKLDVGKLVRPYRLPKENRDLIAAGAAAGVAAAFGAPLGGVLFAIEEGATHMNPKIMVRTFVCATCATLTLRFFMTPLEEGEPWGYLGAHAPLEFGLLELKESAYTLKDLLFFNIMGVLGGLLGAAFIATNVRLTKLRMKFIPPRGARRFIEVICVTMLVASIAFFTPTIQPCGSTMDGSYNESTLPAGMDGSYNESTLPAGNETYLPAEETGEAGHNEVPVNIVYGIAQSRSIRTLFHNKGVLYRSEELLGLFVVHYILCIIVYGLGVPSGLFVPMLLGGAILGRLVAQTLHNFDHLTGGASLGAYALLGAAGLLAGTARITISLAMILIEATQDTGFAIPLFMTTVVATWVGNYFNKGIYDAHIELKHIPLLELAPEPELANLSAADLMERSVVTLPPVVRVGDLVDTLEGCEHNNFPVVKTGSCLVGFVTRQALHHLLFSGKAHGIFQDPAGQNTPISMGKGLLEDSPMLPYEVVAKVHSYFPELEEIRRCLAAEDYEMRIDLAPYTLQGCFTVTEDTSAARCYALFRQMGLRHLPVVATGAPLQGVITRKDLIINSEHDDFEGEAEDDDDDDDDDSDD